jgi:Tfp pilus assembly protein PilV
MNKPLISRRIVASPGAFSLVEVVLALSVVSFSVITLLGLIPIGLKAFNNAAQQAGAANCLRQISSSIQDAVPTGAPKYTANYGLSNFTWNLDGQIQTSTLANLSADGLPTTNAPDERLVAYVEIDSPPAVNTTGTAKISVAWPSRAQWNPATKTWSNAQGSVSTCIVFLPGQ